jgi:hypothetical protein
LPENDVAGANEFDGILAGEFLKQYDADFDFGAGKLNLFLQDHCAGQVVYWTPPAVAVVPFGLDASNHITFRVELDGKRLDAMLDTGATSSVLNLNDARRSFGVDVKSPDVEKIGELVGGFTANIYRRRFKSLAFEGVSISNPVLVLMPDLMTGTSVAAPKKGSLISEGRKGLPSLILGMSTLAQMHVYIAYKERKLYITDSKAQASPRPHERRDHQDGH